jgi:hypothetical protein
MRKETAKLLVDLAATHPKRTLIGLWSDLRKLTKQEFETLIGSGAAARPAKTKRQSPTVTPADSPALRISELLLDRCSLEPAQAATAVGRQLVSQGVAETRIPKVRNGDFQKWLQELFEKVPASKVMHAALQIASRLS